MQSQAEGKGCHIGPSGVQSSASAADMLGAFAKHMIEPPPTVVQPLQGQGGTHQPQANNPPIISPTLLPAAAKGSVVSVIAAKGPAAVPKAKLPAAVLKASVARGAMSKMASMAKQSGGPVLLLVPSAWQWGQCPLSWRLGAQRSHRVRKRRLGPGCAQRTLPKPSLSLRFSSTRARWPSSLRRARCK